MLRGKKISSFQSNEGPKGLKLNWDYTREMSKCDTGNNSFCTDHTAAIKLFDYGIHRSYKLKHTHDPGAHFFSVEHYFLRVPVFDEMKSNHDTWSEQLTLDFYGNTVSLSSA